MTASRWTFLPITSFVLLCATSVPAEEPLRTKPDHGRSQKAGVGLALKRGKAWLEVARVISDSPSARSGKIHPDDRIVSIQDGAGKRISTAHLSVADAVAMIRGTSGTTLSLKILRPNKPEQDFIAVTLVRGTLKELNLFGDGLHLGPGQKTPALKGIRLVERTPFELAAAPGKVVVLEFWAAWCGPCIKAIDELQERRAEHPAWKDRVLFVMVAVDETQEQAAEVLAKRKEKWDGLTLIWTGPSALKDFNIEGLPDVYVIDRLGKVLAAGHDVNLPSILDGKHGVPN